MGSIPPTNRRRVFADSSVLLAAAISPNGYARDLVYLALSELIVLVVRPLVVEETVRNLQAKAPEAIPAFQIFRLFLRQTDPPSRLVLRAKGVVAPKDAPIVAAAAHTRADYLATYDRRHLLLKAAEVREAFGVTVATPDEVISAISRA